MLWRYKIYAPTHCGGVLYLKRNNICSKVFDFFKKICKNTKGKSKNGI